MSINLKINYIVQEMVTKLIPKKKGGKVVRRRIYK